MTAATHRGSVGIEMCFNRDHTLLCLSVMLPFTNSTAILSFAVLKNVCCDFQHFRNFCETNFEKANFHLKICAFEIKTHLAVKIVF